MRLSMGSRTDATLPQAVSVITFVDRVEKDVEGFRHQYDLLSEFAHPNWAGTALLYSKPDPPNLWTDFGANIRGDEGPNKIGVINLSVALMFSNAAITAWPTLCLPLLNYVKSGQVDDSEDQSILCGAHASVAQ